MRIYLCSRVAYDARPFNDTIAAALRSSGHEVYVPHEQAPNNLSEADIADGRYDKDTIFRMDHSAMRQADMCVVAGRVGRDCAWELGWFAAQGVPIVHVPGSDITWETSPMIIPCLTEFPTATEHNINYVVRAVAAITSETK